MKELTFWEFAAAVDGWNRAQGDGHAYRGDPMTDNDYDALCARVEGWINGGS